LQSQSDVIAGLTRNGSNAARRVTSPAANEDMGVNRMNKENLLRKLKSLASIAERGGTPEESKSAAEIMEKLMAKYEVTDADLSDDVVKAHFFKVKGSRERQLFVQVVCKVFPAWDGRFYGVTKGNKTVRNTTSLNCTMVQKVEIDLLFDFYKRLYKKEEERLFMAFVQKHQIFRERPEDDDSPRMPVEEWMKLSALMKGMEDATPYKQIEG